MLEIWEDLKTKNRDKRGRECWRTKLEKHMQLRNQKSLVLANIPVEQEADLVTGVRTDGRYLK